MARKVRGTAGTRARGTRKGRGGRGTGGARAWRGRSRGEGGAAEVGVRRRGRTSVLHARVLHRRLGSGCRAGSARWSIPASWHPDSPAAGCGGHGAGRVQPCARAFWTTSWRRSAGTSTGRFTTQGIFPLPSPHAKFPFCGTRFMT
jgi:hypothetical protein